MPRDFAPPSPPLTIAVIGSGIAGLAAAWLLASRHHVTLFEKDGRLGGHSNTVDAPTGDGRTVPVDTGFIVYNESNYPNLTALFRHLGVATQPSNMSFSVSLDDGAFEYAGGDLKGLLAQPDNLLRRRFWRMLADVLRFYREGPKLAAEPDAATLTLGDYLARERYSDAFVNDHLLPMAAAIWSTPAGDMRAHPALAFVRFCLNHGLMRLSDRPRWRTVTGGSQTYVAAMARALAGRIRCQARVRKIHRRDSGIIVEEVSGALARFDRVIIATHADQALRLLADASAEERQALSAFRYSRNRALLHTDEGLMPRRRAAWASWNYLGRRGDGGGRSVSVTYWMNRLQAIEGDMQFFVTLNPLRSPRSETVLAAFDYEHPAYDHAALTAQARLPELNGERNTWFCGSYFGAGFHEDALVSGLNAAEAAGGVRRPWADDAAMQSSATGIAA